MTRLREDDIRGIAGSLPEYDAQLKRKTGASLRQIACRATGVDEALIVNVLDRISVAAVPISSGLGVIQGFSNALSAIVSHLGFGAFVTRRSDEAGIAEAIEREAVILMLADDEEFVARTPGRRLVVDNAWATAHGFVAGLELMKGGLAGESVLVLGCGPVGVSAAKALLDRGAHVVLSDIEEGRALSAVAGLGQEAEGRVRVEYAPQSALMDYRLIFDATNAGGFIEAARLTPTTMVAAPGMPCALTPEAMAENRDRVLHDALEIGTATMTVQAAAMLAVSAGAGRAGEE